MASLSSDLEHVSLPIEKDSLELPVPAGRTFSRSPSSDEDPGLFSFSLAEPDPPSPFVSGNLPFLASSPEKGKKQDDSDDSAEPEMLCSVEHPCQFFAEAQRLREQKLLLDEEVSVGGQVYGVHRVILAALTFAYEGVLGPASQDEVLAAAEALGAPRVKKAAQLKPEGLGKARGNEKKLSQAEELRENLHSIERLYREGIGCDLELEAEGYRLRGESL
uniref:Kelch-like 33 n=1 Tax=Mus musculus TaxID=10090 RepID=B7ZMY3_MOUSE|nr:Unknown (protein for MGC:178429) [Mus musculus]